MTHAPPTPTTCSSTIAPFLLFVLQPLPSNLSPRCSQLPCSSTLLSLCPHCFDTLTIFAPSQPPVASLNGFSLSGSSLVSLCSSSNQPTLFVDSDISSSSLTSSCPFVQTCLSSSSKFQIPNFSENFSYLLGQGKTPVTRSLELLPLQLSHNTHCLYGSLGHLSIALCVWVGWPKQDCQVLYVWNCASLCLRLKVGALNGDLPFPVSQPTFLYTC